MEVIPNGEVQKVLRSSYDSLDDEYQKTLFLDIACFFNGMDEDYVVRITNGLGIGARFRIDILIDRCLVEIDEDGRLCMHPHVRDMRREIDRQESFKCQRIWHHMEAYTALKETNQDSETVRGLALDMHLLKGDDFSQEFNVVMLAWILFDIQIKVLLFGEACGSWSIQKQSS
ncbi:unnamed protein product [Dovyalis caffra]|uniref:Disease resistance protein Roq1-like winged-helix domain-containing protein n=1 Tax=Dovyalis caffra TaxID=77055 RepID=A0AAV1SJ12_9ROSI|nr:unnamed protein product [Dovyalis caffra]